MDATHPQEGTLPDPHVQITSPRPASMSFVSQPYDPSIPLRQRHSVHTFTSLQPVHSPTTTSANLPYPASTPFQLFDSATFMHTAANAPPGVVPFIPPMDSSTYPHAPTPVPSVPSNSMSPLPRLSTLISAGDTDTVAPGEPVFAAFGPDIYSSPVVQPGRAIPIELNAIGPATAGSSQSPPSSRSRDAPSSGSPKDKGLFGLREVRNRAKDAKVQVREMKKQHREERKRRKQEHRARARQLKAEAQRLDPPAWNLLARWQHASESLHGKWKLYRSIIHGPGTAETSPGSSAGHPPPAAPRPRASVTPVLQPQVPISLTGHTHTGSVSSTASQARVRRSPGPRVWPQDEPLNIAPSLLSPPSHTHVTNNIPRPVVNDKLVHRAYGSPIVSWDIRFPPSSAVLPLPNSAFEPLSPRDYNLAATEPPVTALRIDRLGDDTLEDWPWPVDVTNPAGVTTGDVLQALHVNFTAYLTHSENSLMAPERRKMVHRAARARVDGLPAGRGDAEGPAAADGVRRVDYLAGRYRFRGLGETPGRDGWTLFVGLP